MYRLTQVSSNTKTGPIPTTMSHHKTCPESCEFKGNGCYAEYGPINWHWKKVDTPWEEFLNSIRRLPKHQLWRHNVAGDLEGENDTIDVAKLRQLTAANHRRNGFTYTHYPVTVPGNRTAIEEATAAGFIVNVSANTVKDAVAIKQSGIKTPVVCVLPLDAPNSQTVDGERIVACPAEKSDRVQCSNCGLCALPEREYIVGFRAHGTRKKRVDIIARG